VLRKPVYIARAGDETAPAEDGPEPGCRPALHGLRRLLPAADDSILLLVDDRGIDPGPLVCVSAEEFHGRTDFSARPDHPLVKVVGLFVEAVPTQPLCDDSRVHRPYGTAVVRPRREAGAGRRFRARRRGRACRWRAAV
jgi:hypothetical protein